MPATVLRLLSAAAPESTDAELLGQFLAQRDDAAFTELVRRHGPIVWRVCRRLVGSTSADDAFQATFLILACRAESVRKAASVGSWLIGVAGRVARQLRKHDRRFVPELPDRAAGATSPEHLELAAILDDELTQLPDHLRDPVVLCFLQGQTQQQAATELGGSVRTIRRRLDRAKALLRLRLERRGIVPVVVAGLIAGAEAPVMGVPPAVVQRAVQGTFKFLSGGVSTPASILAKGIVMESAKLKFGGMLSVAAVVVFGLAGGVAKDAKPANTTQPPLPSATKPADANQLIPPPRPVLDRRVQNFLVRTGDPVAARAIVNEAEFQRREIAKQWLGMELPDWEKPCDVRVNPVARPGDGTSTFEFGMKKASMSVLPDYPILLTARMDLGGSLETVLHYDLRRAVAHAVVATHLGVSPPRWVDTGISYLSDPLDEQRRLDTCCRQMLSEGRGIRLRALFRMTEYPKDSSVLIAQSHSVVRFLLTRQALLKGPGVLVDDQSGRRAINGRLNPYGPLGAMSYDFDPRNRRTSVIAFVWIGEANNRPEAWNRGAREVYGFESVDELEGAWLDWLKKPESKLIWKPVPEPPPPNDEKPELIPSTKLPGE